VITVRDARVSGVAFNDGTATLTFRGARHRAVRLTMPLEEFQRTKDVVRDADVIVHGGNRRGILTFK